MWRNTTPRQPRNPASVFRAGIGARAVVPSQPLLRDGDFVDAAAVVRSLLRQRGQIHQDVAGGCRLASGKGCGRPGLRCFGDPSPSVVRFHRWAADRVRILLWYTKLDVRAVPGESDHNRPYGLGGAKIEHQADPSLDAAEPRAAEVANRAPAGRGVTVVSQFDELRVLGLVIALRVEVSRTGDGDCGSRLTGGRFVGGGLGGRGVAGHRPASVAGYHPDKYSADHQKHDQDRQQRDPAARTPLRTRRRADRGADLRRRMGGRDGRRLGCWGGSGLRLTTLRRCRWVKSTLEVAGGVGGPEHLVQRADHGAGAPNWLRVMPRWITEDLVADVVQRGGDTGP